MADTIKQMYKGQPGTGIGNLYGPTAAAKAAIVSIHVCNTTGTVANFSISIGTTGVDTAATREFDLFDVPAHGVIDWQGMITLESGDYITGKQTTSGALTITISGVEQ